MKGPLCGLKFIVGVEIVERALFPVQNLLIAEEALQFHGSRFGRIGSVNNVFLKTHAVRTADSARSGVAPVGRAGQRAHGGNGIDTLQTERNDGSRHHGVLYALKERLRAEVCIMFAQQFVGELHHLAAADVEAFPFKDIDDFAHEGTLQCARFEQHECFFQSHFEFKISDWILSTWQIEVSARLFEELTR